MRLISCHEKSLGKLAEKELIPNQPGDIPATYSDVDVLVRDVGFKPEPSIGDGVTKFVSWYHCIIHDLKKDLFPSNSDMLPM